MQPQPPAGHLLPEQWERAGRPLDRPHEFALCRPAARPRVHDSVIDERRVALVLELLAAGGRSECRIAEAAGVSRSTVQRVKRGERRLKPDRLPCLPCGVQAMAFSPDSKWLATANGPDWDQRGDSWCPNGLTNIGDEPRASGEADLTEVVWVGSGYSSDGYFWMEYYTGTLTVQCWGVTPGATYCICTGWDLSPPLGTVTANTKGELRGTVEFTGDVYVDISYVYDWWSGWVLASGCHVCVVRLDPDGSSATVLKGRLAPPYSWSH